MRRPWYFFSIMYRMRKYIFALLLTFVTSSVFAVSCAGLSSTECTNIAGCGWDNLSADCIECAPGKYAKKGDSQCKNCSGPKPSGWGTSIFASNTFLPNPTDEKCYWEVTCAANLEFQKGDEGSCKNNTCTCKQCGDNYKFNSTNGASMAKYAEPNWLDISIIGGRCEGKIYKITLKPNFMDASLGDDPPTVYEQYNTGFSTNANGPFDEEWIMPRPGGDAIRTLATSNCGTFLGFGKGDTTYITNVGYLSGSYGNKSFNSANTTPSTNTTEDGTIELLGKWDAKPYTIKYTCPNSGVTPPTTNCKFGTNCTVAAANACGNGKIVTGWTCTENCGNIQGGNKPGDEISFSACPITDSATTTYTITLQATEKDCTAGYYCDSTGEHKCPYGSTSSSGASNITNCYYDNTITFTDNTGASFKLPDGTTINYSGN